MSIIWLESFDLGRLGGTGGSGFPPALGDLGRKGWVSNAGDGGAFTGGSLNVISGGRTGQGIQWQQGGIISFSPWLGRQVLPANEHIQFTMGFALYLNALTGYTDLCWLCSDELGTLHTKLAVGPGGQLHAYGGPGMALIGSSNQQFLTVGNWNYIEFASVLDPTDGAVYCSVNDLSVIHVTSVPTKNGGTKTKFDSIKFISSNPASFIVDDHYLTNGAGLINNGMVGDMNIYVTLPTNNGDLSELINDLGTSSNNYAHVNSPHTQTVTYVQSNSPDAEDTYVMSPLPLPDGEIMAVQSNFLAQKNNTGLRQIIPIIRESGTDHAGTEVSLGTSVAYYQEVYEQDPGTGSQWSVAGVNNAQLGVRIE